MNSVATAIAKYLRNTYPGLQELAYNYSGFREYGLMRDDLIYEGPEVREALKRVPPHIVEERNFRIVRAMQLDCSKQILPKEQWTKLENDVHYLLPHLEDVIKERKEKEKWEAS